MSNSPSGPGHTFLQSLASPLVLAPMEGVTHPAFRRLVAGRGGLGMVCTEFVRISVGSVSPKGLRRAVDKVSGLPLSVQVMGRDPESLAEAARIVHRAGADVVDLNLGCPAPKAVRGGVGAAMLKDPALLAEVVGALRQAGPGLLAAKIRAGFEEKDPLFLLEDWFALLNRGERLAAVGSSDSHAWIMRAPTPASKLSGISAMRVAATSAHHNACNSCTSTGILLRVAMLMADEMSVFFSKAANAVARAWLKCFSN